MAKTQTPSYLSICLASSIVSSLNASFVYAGDIGTANNPLSTNPVVTLLGGYAGTGPTGGNSHAFEGTDTTQFIYHNNGNNNGTGFVGAFLGVEHPLFQSGFSMQTGIEYTHFGTSHVKGQHMVGIEPTTSTLYHYHYQVRTDQVLVVTKWLAMMHQRYHPYVSVGLGAAFNHAGQYRVSTLETGSINLTAMFNNHQHTAFSYSLGLGVDTTVTQNLRVGLGYRLSDFGRQSLGSGRVEFNNYSFPVSFTLSKSHAFVNQLQVQISYLFHS